MWGWGGEDDVLADRMSARGLVPPIRPDASFVGAIIDMEDELIKERGEVHTLTHTQACVPSRERLSCQMRSDRALYSCNDAHPMS